MDAKHSTQATSADASEVRADGGRFNSSQTREITKKGENKGKHQLLTTVNNTVSLVFCY